MSMTTRATYQHLDPRRGSNCRQSYLKGRRIRAAMVDEAVHGPDPRTREEFALDYGVPLEAVLEALEDVARDRAPIRRSTTEKPLACVLMALGSQRENEASPRRKPV